jgi:hypothetical protein
MDKTKFTLGKFPVTKAKVKHARGWVASYEKLSCPGEQKKKNVKNIIRCTPFNEIFISLIVPTGLWNCPATHNISSFFNEMHFKLNYDKVFNDNDVS